MATVRSGKYGTILPVTVGIWKQFCGISPWSSKPVTDLSITVAIFQAQIGHPGSVGWSPHLIVTPFFVFIIYIYTHVYIYIYTYIYIYVYPFFSH